MLSFLFKPPSLLSFVLLVVAFLSSFCGGSGVDVAVVVVGVVVVVVVGLVGVAFCFPSSVLEDDPAADDDFKVDLAAVDEFSVALPFSTGFEDLEFESIPVAMRSATPLRPSYRFEIKIG